MKKINLFILVIMLSLLIGCQKKNNNSTDDDDKDDTPGEVTTIELLDDPTFETGFNVLGISPPVDGRKIYRHLDYGGTAKQADREVWYMGQWWTPYDVKDATYENVDGIHTYETPSRTVKVNPEDNGYYYVELLGSEEYSKPRESGEPWPHALIEQNFTQSVKVGDLSKLILKLEVTIFRADNTMGSYYNSDFHAAQLLWYVTMRNVVPEDSNYSDVGENGDYLWFGIPIYDSRYNFIPESKHIDRGAPGTTNKLIYSMSSRNYFDEKIVMGKTYQIEIDILPYLKEAFIYAVNNDALVNCKLDNMEVDYMNFGWELPGTFDVESAIRGLSITAYK